MIVTNTIRSLFFGFILGVTSFSIECVHPLYAAEISENLCEGKLPAAWIEQKSDKGKPTIAIQPKGLTILSEQGIYASVKRRNEIVGTDRNPLITSCWVWADHENAGLGAGVAVYWDNNNYIWMPSSLDNNYTAYWRVKGVDGAWGVHNVITDAKARGVYVRVVLTTHNCFLSVSSDGSNWRSILSLGFRPQEGVAPSSIILGRCSAGPIGDVAAKLEMANDWNPNKNPKQYSCIFRDFTLRDTAASAVEPLELQAKEDWDKTVESLETPILPRNWTLLGPRPDTNFKLYDQKGGLTPDTTDDWQTSVPLDETGKPFRKTAWTRPDDDVGCYVDLGETFDLNTQSVAYAKTEMDWPVNGKALVWMDYNGRVQVFVNNQLVQNYQDRHLGAVKDRRCIPIKMKKGRNTIKVKSGQNAGAWGFFLRVERSDPAYRIQMLEKLIPLHPEEATGWRGAQGLLEIARRHEELFQFEQAVATWTQVLEKFGKNDEVREDALENQLRMFETLRDWGGLLSAGEYYLAKFPTEVGRERAFQKCVLAECHLHKIPAAEARVVKWVDALGTDGTRVALAWRTLACAARESGDKLRQYAALSKLMDSVVVSKTERARAAFESAFSRCGVESPKLPTDKIDNASLSAACSEAQKGLLLLPGVTHPHVQSWIKEAEEDLKAGRVERAIAGYWGAALMASCASDSEAASVVMVNKSYKLPILTMDPATKKPRDFSDPIKQEALTLLNQITYEPKWLGAGWKAVGPFENTDGIGMSTAYGPEINPDWAKRHPGRGGEKGWVDVDPKALNEYGQDLKAALGDCRGGVVYVSREFECAEAHVTKLYLGTRAGWSVWLDGKLLGAKAADSFQLDRSPIPLKLTAGKHRLLLKLVWPGDDICSFRVRISDEPELAVQLLKIAWLYREFPAISRFYASQHDIYPLLVATRLMSNGAAVRVYGQAVDSIYPAYSEARCVYNSYSLERQWEFGEHDTVVAGLKNYLNYLSLCSDVQNRSVRVWWATNLLFSALSAQGDTVEADDVLKTFIMRYPEYYAEVGCALSLRGTLRQDFSLAQSSRPIFERLVRDYPHSYYNYAEPGLLFSKNYLHERIQFETSSEAQTSVDAATRQLKTGNAQDVERAMRNLAEVIHSGTKGLVRINDSRTAPLYVGVREYFRALLMALSDELRDTYLKTVEAPSKQRYENAAAFDDISALETVASDYYYTPAAMKALNRVGNLYMDRGAWGQATAAFKYLLQEYKHVEGFNEPLISAKHAFALFRDGQHAAARQALELLQKEHGTKTLLIGGQTQAASQFVQGLLQQIVSVTAHSNPNASIPSITSTYASDMTRNGAPLTAAAPRPSAVLWSQNTIPSASADRGRAWYVPDPFTHLQSYPVVSGNKAFVGTLESLQAMDLSTGETIWAQNWVSSAPTLLQAFQGFSRCCPTVSNDKIYMRALAQRQSVLKCFASENGQLLWSTEGVAEFKRAQWISDPLIAFGVIVACYLEVGAINTHGLAAFDLQTGCLRWKTALVSGSTGLRVGSEFVPTALHLGPPSGDRGVIYAATGLNSLAAVNAFNGEVLWVAGYPRTQTGLFHDGFASNLGGKNIRNSILKLFARGPSSPIVTDDLILIAPQDSLGLFAFDRKIGTVRWALEMIDSRFIAGVCENKILMVDNTVKAIDIHTGTIAWEYELQEEMLFGQPGYSGGILYLPGEDKITLLDARTGRSICSQPWDNRIGPIANLVITPNVILGVSETHVVGIAPEGSVKKEMALLEAKHAESIGNLEVAAERYLQALRRPTSNELPIAISGWVRVMEKLNKKADALAALEGLLQDKPAIIISSTGLWRVAKSVLLEGLRTRLGQPPPVVPPVPNELGGSLTYAWQLEGENPLTFFPKTGPQDRFYAVVGSTLYCIKFSAQLEILWQNYAGTDIFNLAAGPTTVVVASKKNLTTLDRTTGEQLWSIALPSSQDRIRKNGKRQPSRNTYQGFGEMAVDENSVAVAAGSSLYCYDLHTGVSRWSNDFVHRGTQYLAFVNGNLSEFYSTEQKNRFFTVWNTMTGANLKQVALGAGHGWSNTVVSPDEKYFIARSAPTSIYALDVATGNKVWETPVANLNVGHAAWMCLRTKDNLLTYSGNEEHKGWMDYYLNPSDGKIVSQVFSGICKSGNSSVTAIDHGGKTVIRTDDDGKGNRKEIWKVTLPDALVGYQYHVKSCLFKNRMYSMYLKDSQKGRDHYVLRTWDCNSGQVLKNEIVPGTCVWGYGHTIPNAVEQHGSLLLYTAAEGLFAYTSLGETATETITNLNDQIRDPNLPAIQRREARRSVSALDPQVLHAFLISSEAKTGDWKHSDSLLLQAPKNYTPLSHELALKTPQDLSAKVYAAWNNNGLALAVYVVDDKFVSPRLGAALESGDSIRIDINPFTDTYSGFNVENLSCQMALVNGQPVIRVSAESSADTENQATGYIVRSSDGRGAHYEVFLPWPLIRREAHLRPGTSKELRVGIAVFDDDGAGVKGAIEWGASVTSPTLAPMRLGLLSLQDISLEKIERYRKIIAQLPDEPESSLFMELILRSKRGATATQDRIAELEAYVKAHPAAESSNLWLGRLCKLYQTRGEADPIGKTFEFARVTKCPASTLENIKGKVLKFWVLLDEKNPTRMIMLQFNIKGLGWSKRAYWGESLLEYGREGTPERLCMGPLPKLGQWTQLEIRPIDFGIAEQDIVGCSFVSFGGLVHWDRLSYLINGKETDLMNDALPANARLEGNPLQFVDNPKKEGMKSWTGGPTTGLLNSYFAFPDTWFSFKSVAVTTPIKPPDANALAATATRYRDAALLLPDSPEGLVFFRRILEQWDPKSDTYTATCIGEIEKYLQAHPATQHATALLQMLRTYYQSAKEPNPTAKCEDVIRKVKLSRDNTRAFYSSFVPTWMDYHVIGPFGAFGDRRGLETVLPPEKSVDLTWTTKAFAEVEQKWEKYSFAKDAKGKPNESGWVNLHAVVISKLDDTAKKELLKGSYFAYATVKFNLPTKRRAILLFGANDMISIWVNGRRVVSESQPGNYKDREIKEGIQLTNGANEILIKVGVYTQALGFYFRIADENGRPFDDITFP